MTKNELPQAMNSEKRNITSTASPSDCSADEISLIDLFIVLWRGKFIIAGCAFIAAVAGVVFALLAPEMFSTSSLFVTKTGKQSSGNLSQLASLAGINIGGGGGSIDPSDYLDKVIEDKDFIATLFDRRWFFKGDTLPLEEILKIVPDTVVPNWQYVYFMRKIESIRRGKIVSLKKDAKNGLLTLSTEAPDPQLAYDLNVFVLNYLSSYIRNSIKSQAKEKRIFIEDRLLETRRELEKSEDALAKFRGSNLMTRSPQAILEEARLTRNVTINQEIYIQFEKQYELARIEELDDQTLIQIVKSAEVPVIRSRPKKKQIVIVAGMAGIFLGMVSVLLFNIAAGVLNSRMNKATV